MQEAAEAEIVNLFRLAYRLDRLRAYDEAFAALDRGNRLAGAFTDAESEAANEEAIIRSILELPNRAALAVGEGNLSTAPIFVFGKPRSGSTLIEQILASHPAVQGLGEPLAFPTAAGARGVWANASRMKKLHSRQIATDYLKAMAHLGWDGVSRFVDKLPQNFLYAGVIAAALPGAVMLHSTRDPMATCLSIYQQHFTEPSPLSYDLGQIGRSYVRYRRLMEHWAEVLPGRVLDVCYEDLVADPERQIRWLVTEACGLPWDDRCLRFYENDRVVLTASADQVRQPIFTTSVGRWRNYERHLGPLIEALGPYAPAR